MLRILIVVNWLGGAAIFALLVAMPTHQWIMSSLVCLAVAEAERMILGLRAIAALGLATIPLNYTSLKRAAGDGRDRFARATCFVAANAIVWRRSPRVLVTLQCVSLVIGAIVKSVSRPAHPLRISAGFRSTRWFAVLLTFPAGPRVRGRDADARRPRRDGLTWRSPSSSTTSSTIGRMTLTELADQIRHGAGHNLSILKTGKARAIRFSTSRRSARCSLSA